MLFSLVDLSFLFLYSDQGQKVKLKEHRSRTLRVRLSNIKIFSKMLVVKKNKLVNRKGLF